MNPLRLTILDWFPNSKNSKERIVYVLELDCNQVLEHFQDLKKIISCEDYDAAFDLGPNENLMRRRYDEENNLESDYSMSSTSLNSSGEHAGDEYFDSSGMVSTDENI